MQVLFEASYLIAKKGWPYSDFSSWLEWAELQGTTLSVPYKNQTQCTEFIKCTDQVSFDKNVRNKLERINFIAIFCDRSTDSVTIRTDRPGELCYNFSNDLTQMVNFPLGSQTLILIILLFWIYFFLLLLVFVLQWLSFHWEILIMFCLSFHWLTIKFTTGCPILSHSLWLFLCWLGWSLWSFERCSMGGYL